MIARPSSTADGPNVRRQVVLEARGNFNSSRNHETSQALPILPFDQLLEHIVACCSKGQHIAKAETGSPPCCLPSLHSTTTLCCILIQVQNRL